MGKPIVPPTSDKNRKSLFDLEGKIELAPGYDYKALRSGEPTEVMPTPAPR